MKRYLIYIFMLSTLWFAQTVSAACGLSIAANNVTIPWTLNFTYIAVQVDISRSNSDACNFSLGFTKGNGASYNNRRADNSGNLLRYQLYQNAGLSNILKDDIDVTTIATETVQDGFQAGPVPVTKTVIYYLEVPYNLATTPSLASGGIYTDTYTINVYETDVLPLGSPVATKTITLTVDVPKMIALSLVDSGGVFVLGQLNRSVAFGTLTQGQAASMDLRVRTNAGFSVTFSSTNNGNLKHTDAAKNSLVPYSLIVNGVTLNMTNSNAVPVTGLSGSGSTGLSGLGYPIRVVIGSLTGSSILAGPHSDAVTITATTTE